MSNCRHYNARHIWGKGDAVPLDVKGIGEFDIIPTARHRALVGRPTPRKKVAEVYKWCPECGALKIGGKWLKPSNNSGEVF